MKQYLINLFIGVDQFWNTVFWGHPDETISSRAGRAARKGKPWGCLLCWLLDKLDRGHCEKAIEECCERKAAPHDPQ